MMTQIELEIRSIQENYQLNNISREEHDYLLTEIRDIRLARECSDNETLFRHLFQLCNMAIRVI